MQSERWQQVTELFEAAAEMKEPERTRYLQEECAGDRELLAEIESLLASHEQASQFIEQPIAAVPREVFSETRSDRSDEQFGAYRIIREIGRGGLGTVYLAERADDEYRKEVAIKLVRRGLDTEDILRRFRNERQILAQLDHPNIARLIDGGTTEDGLPYFVMEYVKGETIGAYCESHALDLRTRLELFQKVCAAVTYAHQNLVIHRDLKPSNILVTPEGEPKLLDFGIAKLLTTDENVFTVTVPALRVMTPDYASPEQIRGEKITTGSDVYSLGVVLFELLTGQKPYRLTGRTQEELSRAITDHEPSRPSALVSERSKLIGGDLDKIILMALRKEPERRYPSVERFSDDIRRFLGGLPVSARRDTFSYRTQKFLQRNKIGVAAAVMVYLLLAGGVVVTLIQAERVARERDHARREAAKAERINTFLQNVLAFSSPSWLSSNTKHNREATVVEALEAASQRVETELTDQPEVAAAVDFTLGMTFRSLSRFELAEKHMRESLAIRRRLLGPQDQDVAQSLAGLGDIIYASKNGEAESSLREAIAIYRRAEKNGEVDAKWFTIALSDMALVVQFSKKGDPKEAVALFQEALQVADRLKGADRAPIPIIYSNLGNFLFDHGDIDSAIAYTRKAIKEEELVPGEGRMETGTFLNNLGNALGARGDLAEGRAVLQKSIVFYMKALGDSHSYTTAPIANLADNYCRAGEYDRALEESRRAVDILKRAYPDDERIDYVRAWIPLGKALTHTGELAEGEKILRRAVEIGKQKLPAKHRWIANAQGALGENLALQNRNEEAHELLLTSYDNMKSSLGEKNPATVAAAERLEKFRQAQSQKDQPR